MGGADDDASYLTTVPTSVTSRPASYDCSRRASGCAACCAPAVRQSARTPAKTKNPVRIRSVGFIFPFNLRECHSEPFRVAETTRIRRFDAHSEGSILRWPIPELWLPLEARFFLDNHFPRPSDPSAYSPFLANPFPGKKFRPVQN